MKVLSKIKNTWYFLIIGIKTRYKKVQTSLIR